MADIPSDPPPPYSALSPEPSCVGSPSPEPESSSSARPARDIKSVYPHWDSLDPRSSSSQSLGPSEADAGVDVAGHPGQKRRTFLIVYIHGFMGNDLSFRSFPAHVHNYLKGALAATHVIHSKIYPRYKTYKAIDIATANFSDWLAPHESDMTDVILVGHSMGGILAADVVLLRAQDRVGTPRRNRILGTVSIDCPFLGLHPGIIASGLASLFRQGQSDEKQFKGSQVDTPGPNGPLSPNPSFYSDLTPGSVVSSPVGGLSSPQTTIPSSASASASTSGQLVVDSFFNPPFENDVQFKDRGWFRNVAHFAKKYSSENLVEAATSHILSHLEFGGVLADYPGLRTRYNKIRHLEDVDELANRNPSNVSSGGPCREARVRFVNYYTLSSGLPVLPKPLHKHNGGSSSLNLTSSVSPSSISNLQAEPGESRSQISITTYSDNVAADGAGESEADESDSAETPMQRLEPMPIEDDEGFDERIETGNSRDTPISSLEQLTLESNKSQDQPVDETPTGQGAAQPEDPSEASTDAPSASAAPDLPEIPDLPDRPEPPQLDQITDKEERKKAEKAAKAVQKAYEQAVKSRDKVVKERERLTEKHLRKEAKEAERMSREAQKRERDEAKRLEKEAAARSKAEIAAVAKEAKELARQEKEERRKQEQEAKERRKQEAVEQHAREKGTKDRKFCMTPRRLPDGTMDRTWVPVHMRDVDEVSAHTTIFCPEPHYEKLVGDVCELVVTWVHDDLSTRAILAAGDGSC